MAEEHIDLPKIIKEWAEKIAADNHTELDWIDWGYKKDRDEYNLIAERERFQHGSIKILRPEDPVPQGQGKRLAELERHEKIAGGGFKGSKEIEIQATVREEKSVSYTKSFDVGLDLGASYYVDIGLHADYATSKTKGNVQVKEEVRREKLTLQFVEGYDYDVLIEVFSTEYIQNIIREIELKGRIPIHFKKDILFPNNGRGDDKKHQLNLIPIGYIISELQKGHSLPNDIACKIDGGNVIFKQKGIYTYTHCNFQTNSTKVPTSGYKKAADTDKKDTPVNQVGLTLNPTAIGENVTVQGDVTRPLAVGINLGGALGSDSRTKNLNDTLRTLGEEGATIAPSAVGKSTKVIGNLHKPTAIAVETHENQTKPASDSYESVLQPENAGIKKFAHRIFLKLEASLNEKFATEISQDANASSAVLERLESEIKFHLDRGAAASFDSYCKGKSGEPAVLNIFAEAIANEIVKNCRSLKNIKIDEQYINDGFVIAAKSVPSPVSSNETSQKTGIV
jgi:hypothetical protein